MGDEEYRRNFRNKASSQEAYSSAVSFGAIYIQRRLNLTDRQLVKQIAETSYMRTLSLYKECRSEKPFDSSFLVTFRKRLPEKVMNRIIERSFIEATEDQDGKKDEDDNSSSGSVRGTGADLKESPIKGALIINATCASADIENPTDLELCDNARRWAEVTLDRYWKLFNPVNSRDKKPRTYREIVRRWFLKIIKRRKSQ